MLDAIDYSETYGEICPANWRKGDKAMVASAAGLKEWSASR
jgi:peroxiredoxin (alkyl hydroperoxide reductase subunit C)